MSEVNLLGCILIGVILGATQHSLLKIVAATIIIVTLWQVAKSFLVKP